MLRNSIINRVHTLEDDVIPEIGFLPSCVQPLQASEVIGPLFVAPQRDRGVAKLVDDVPKILAETASQQPTNILEHERQGPNLPNGSNGLGEQVPAVARSAVLAANGERLTGRPPAHEQHVTTMLEKIVGPNVAFNDLPIAYVLDAVVMVAAKGTAGVVVPLNDDLVAQSGLGCPKGKPARPGEQLHAFHGGILSV
jgi:hypothetical protein